MQVSLGETHVQMHGPCTEGQTEPPSSVPTCLPTYQLPLLSEKQEADTTSTGLTERLIKRPSLGMETCRNIPSVKRSEKDMCLLFLSILVPGGCVAYSPGLPPPQACRPWKAVARLFTTISRGSVPRAWPERGCYSGETCCVDKAVLGPPTAGCSLRCPVFPRCPC